MATTGHCMKCKTKRDIKDVTILKTERGAFRAQGTCTTCGGKVSAMKSKEDADKALAEGAKKGY